MDKRGSVCGIAKGLPDFADRRVDAGFDINEHVLAPQPVDDVAAGDELTSVFDQQDEEVHWASLEFDGAPLAPQLVRGDIELEITEPKRLTRVERRHGA